MTESSRSRLRELHDRLGSMIDQVGHPDYSLRELVDGLREVRDELLALSETREHSITQAAGESAVDRENSPTGMESSREGERPSPFSSDKPQQSQSATVVQRLREEQARCAKGLEYASQGEGGGWYKAMMLAKEAADLIESLTPSHGGERLYTEAQVREACERAIAPILEKLNSMPSASGESSEPRGGPWNVGDQQEPDGYVVLIKDAGSAKRGYWLSHAYVERSFADREAEACKGEVMPIYFAPFTASIPQDAADTLRDLIDYARAFVPLTWEGRKTHQDIMKRGLQLLAAIGASESKARTE
jgi:hypothetical protein